MSTDPARPNAGATGAYQPPAQGSESEPDAPTVPLGTADLPQPAGTSVYEPSASAAAPSDPVALPGTRLYGPADTGATGEYASGSVGLPENGSALDVDDGVAGATGRFVPGTAAPEVVSGQTTDLAGATGAYDPNAPTVPAHGHAAPPESRCGRYVLKRFHAKGGMGEIWMAEDPAIGRVVALKRMLGRRHDQQRRFRVEAQVTGQLEHPGIVPVHELGTNEQGLPFYTMKFVRGRTLAKIIQEFHKSKAAPGTREVERVRLLHTFVSLCQTVAYAHSKGVLHRDLKPENVMVGSYGETLLLDWGIAKVLGRPEEKTDDSGYVHLQEVPGDTETMAGTIMGSPSYMAPEVAAGLNQEVDQRSDVYLLGATLYEILTGKMPREGKSALEMITKAQKQPAVAPRKIKPEVPKALEAVCLKAMATRKEDRYQTALALADEVQRYVAGEPVSAYREGVLQRIWRWAKRHRKALVRAGAAALLLGLALFGYAKWREAEDRRVAAQRETERLKALDQARLDLMEFQRRSDEARYYAASTDPVSENAPYFDPRQGETRIRDALAFAADTWGPTLDKLPLTEESDSINDERYDLLLLLAQAKAAKPQTAGEILAVLDEAGALRTPSRNLYRLMAGAHRQLGEAGSAAEDERRADDPETPTTALDHFLLGEGYRREASSATDRKKKQQVGRADPALIEKAVAEYREALRLDPDHYWSYLQLARCHLSVARYAEAVEALGACVALRPKSPWAFSVRGSALLLQSQPEAALRDLNKAVKLGTGESVSRLNRGVAYSSLHRDADALADFAAILDLPHDKRLIEAAFYRGQLYLQRGEDQKALDDFNLVIAEKPHPERADLYRALIHVARGDHEKALADLDVYVASRYHDVRRDGWEIHGLRGLVLRDLFTERSEEKRRGRMGQALAALAVAELSTAEKQGAEKAVLFDDLGAMLEFVGKPEDAAAAYTKGLELAPQDVPLLNKRGWVYALKLSLLPKALADFTAAAAADPNDPEAHAGIGYLRARQKLTPQAQQEAELALLHGTDLKAPRNYLNLHNVACIYAVLSAAGDRYAPTHQDIAMALLRRAVALWEKEGTVPSEIDQIKNDPALKPLSAREDFKQLIGEKKKP